MNYLIIALHIVLVCLLLRLCYTDVRDRVISNRVVALLFFIVVPLSLLQHLWRLWSGLFFLCCM